MFDMHQCNIELATRGSKTLVGGGTKKQQGHISNENRNVEEHLNRIGSKPIAMGGTSGQCPFANILSPLAAFSIYILKNLFLFPVESSSVFVQIALWRMWAEKLN